ncbi:MAG TPA: cytochrome c maturation protein CcmE [Acidobacteriota bacterium]|nr:cytochrome c maturation protein CcmE [Acidobacteriota bacterium]
MTARYIVGGVIIAVFLVWGASAFLQTTVQYVSIGEAGRSARVVQVMGKIDFDHVTYNAAASRLEFSIYDTEAVDPALAPRLPVVYYGVVPGNFEQATSVVLKGKPDAEGTFVAEQMLVKCPSKYQGESGDEYQNVRKHQDAQGTSGV